MQCCGSLKTRIFVHVSNFKIWLFILSTTFKNQGSITFKYIFPDATTDPWESISNFQAHDIKNETHV